MTGSKGKLREKKVSRQFKQRDWSSELRMQADPGHYDSIGISAEFSLCILGLLCRLTPLCSTRLCSTSSSLRELVKRNLITGVVPSGTYCVYTKSAAAAAAQEKAKAEKAAAASAKDAGKPAKAPAAAKGKKGAKEDAAE
jgi:hypothetical protein